MGASSPFTIQEHIVPCHHIREDVVRTSLDDGADWRMSVKQYTPLDNLNPAEGDLTILAAPCLGFPKVGTTRSCRVDIIIMNID